MLAAGQLDQRLKFEVLVPVISEESPAAVCSFNYHQDKFGLAFGILFAILGLWPLFHQTGSPKWGLIALSTAILAVALLRSHWLMPLNRGWFKLGLALSRIVNPFVMRSMQACAASPS